MGRSLTHHHRSFQKDIRSLLPCKAVKVLRALEIFEKVELIDKSSINLIDEYDEFVLPDEDVSHEFAENFLKGKNIIYVNTFLRWDSNNVKAHKEVKSATEIELSLEDSVLIEEILQEADKSIDQYRQVAGAVFKDDEFCLVTHNKIVPLIYTYLYEGDPRSQFKKGINIDSSLALHAEQGLIAQAAKEGISLDGSTMVVTDFPCPVCAKLIAHSGVKKVFYLKGYAMLDGERILQDKDVEICKIKTA
jgi:dCMP deaminase